MAIHRLAVASDFFDCSAPDALHLLTVQPVDGLLLTGRWEIGRSAWVERRPAAL